MAATQALGNGWRSDSLKPGTTRSRRRSHLPSGCPTSTATQSVIVRATSKVARVRLTPRGCALVSFDASPKGARYVLTSLTTGDTVPARRGTVPVERLLLPVGDYSRVISYEKCADYADTVHVGMPERLPSEPCSASHALGQILPRPKPTSRPERRSHPH